MATNDNPEVIEPQSLAVYDPFRAQLAKFKEENSRLVFEYETKAGNKEARSYVHKLRGLKKPVDDARVKAKAVHLETGRKIDEQAKDIIAEVQEMIDVHQKILDEIEQREKDRIASIELRMNDLQTPLDTDNYSIDDLKKLLAEIKAVKVDDSFEEFANKAATIKDQSVTALETKIQAREKSDADAAELSKLREEAIERDRKDREAQVKADAVKQAEADAANREKALKAKAAAEKKAAKEKAERVEKELAEAQERGRAELKAQKERAKKQRAESAKREADLKAENQRLQEEANERDKQTKKVQTAIAELKKSVDIADGQSAKFIQLKLSTGKTLLKELEK